MRSLLKYLPILLLINFVFGQTLYQESYDDRILVCLKPDISIDDIGANGATPLTGLASLDELLGSRKIVRMERYLPGATPEDRDGDIVLSNIYRLTLGPKQKPAKYTITEFAADENILFAEPEVINRVNYSPDDPLFDQQWYLPKVGAPEAWELWDVANGDLPGDNKIVLASVDSGVEYTHPDLWKNVWVNQGEIPLDIKFDVDLNKDFIITPNEIVAYVSDYNGDGVTNLQDALHGDSPFTNGVDDNNNTSEYVDDLFGWDVSGTTSGVDPDNDPMAALEGAAGFGNRTHGTHVAGLLAAVSNNSEGVTSTIFNGSIMSVKCMYDEDSNGLIPGGWGGMLYAAKSGADIINCSWGGPGFSASNQSVVNVIVNTYGSIVVAAAGNGDDSGNPTDTPHYPSGYDNVVSVTAVGPSDNFSWANYGADLGDGKFFGVDISAPGEGLMSTILTNTAGNAYAPMTGTSMASPLVASCIGLLKAANPTKSNAWLIDTILETADPIDEINPNFAGQLGSGRVNILRALERDKYPSLAHAGLILDISDTDGDGRLSPGEEGTLTIDLSNEPEWGGAVGVSAILRSSSEFVSILDSMGTFPDIAGGSTQSNVLDQFSFQLSPDAPSAIFPFSLEVKANEGQAYPYLDSFDFSVENIRWQAGFPITTAQIKSGNAIADLDGDGAMEIIFASADSSLHAITNAGTELAGFPVKFNHKAEVSPAVGDIDKDGDLEIVIPSWDKNIYVVQHDGSAEAIYTASNIFLAPPALYDLDVNGDLEIVALSYDKQLLVMHHDGTLLPNYPLELSGYLGVGPAIGDVNADGMVDIVVATLGNQVHALNIDGTDLAGFPIEMSKPIQSAPTLANLDGDAAGTLEILFGADDKAFHAYSSTGTELWSTPIGSTIRTDPAVADMDGDGAFEIAFGASDRGMYVLNDDGSLLPGWPVYAEGVIHNSPVIANLNKNGSAELFFGATDHFTYGLNADGSNYYGFPIESYGSIQGTSSIADMDGDDDIELVIGSLVGVGVVDMVDNANTKKYWPTHRGNLYRTGAPASLIPVGVETVKQIPLAFSLQGNYPNPFNASTQIKFSLPQATQVRLEIIDIRGRVREALINEAMGAGDYVKAWDGMFDGISADAGVYLYRLSTPGATLIRKMTLLK
ncbi:MAG: S8 family serine peptidase [Candidatus Marinimicrobia bacterium]|nr:S8 family serine peptidase [Candidatus Neomarinimicrobiota bacterium]MCF7905341.1 S8 family serine peptidase [Candidatus Neomarinimicrobiota bacterium]